MTNTESSNRLPLFLLYGAIALLAIGLLVWSSLRTLRETPARETSVEFPSMGWVTVRLTTEPFPPLPSGTVALNLMGMNSRGVMVDLGPSIPFTFGTSGSETALGSGIAAPQGGSYRGGVQFPIPGDYWLIFDLPDGKQARFQLTVEPAQ